MTLVSVSLPNPSHQFLRAVFLGIPQSSEARATMSWHDLIDDSSERRFVSGESSWLVGDDVAPGAEEAGVNNSNHGRYWHPSADAYLDRSIVGLPALDEDLCFTNGASTGFADHPIDPLFFPILLQLESLLPS